MMVLMVMQEKYLVLKMYVTKYLGVKQYCPQISLKWFHKIVLQQ
jgi:hypothetical protein